MKRFYFVHNGQVREVTEEEYVSVEGDESTRDYVADVYYGKTSIDDVPEDFREQVVQTVAKRTEMFGDYISKELSDSEALDIILGGETT